MESNRPTVGLATSRGALALDEDLPFLIDAFARLQVLARPVVWDDSAVDWKHFDAVIVRSTWDYIDHLAKFLQWARDVEASTTLLNSASVLAWNTDKRYLIELEKAGIPTVPTQWWVHGDDISFPTANDFIVKPSISAGSRFVSRFSPGDPSAAAHAEQILAQDRGHVMVQPFQEELDVQGETDMVFIDGIFSHAVRKLVRATEAKTLIGGLFVEEEIGSAVPTPEQLDVAQRALAAVSGSRRFLYARVDVVDTAQNGPLVLELEATEPSLFLAHAPGAADLLAGATRRTRG